MDDLRDPPPGWVLARTVAEAIHWLQTGGVTHLSLDHDMGEEDGYAVVVWIERELHTGGVSPPARMESHSMNPAGRHRIERAIAAIELHRYDGE